MTQATDRYITKQGDTLSNIAYRHYGSSIGQVERILEANPQLCRHPALLAAGIEITLPPMPKRVTHVQTVNLWN